MLGFDDDRWQNLTGVYRTRFDPRPLLAKLEADEDTKAAWQELWEELYHQGDVGEASYAAVPRLVRIFRERREIAWNTYAIVAVIELARGKGHNPKLPEWLDEAYFRALQELAETGAARVLHASDPEEIRAILSILALASGAITHARILLNYSDEELLELEMRASRIGSQQFPI